MLRHHHPAPPFRATILRRHRAPPFRATILRRHRAPPFRAAIARRRPPARGGPTIHDTLPTLFTWRTMTYIVGPPLAGGLPGVACDLVARGGFAGKIRRLAYDIVPDLLVRLR